MKQEFEMPKVGDVVYLGQEKGEVVSIETNECVYPIRVKFKEIDSTLNFTKEGYILEYVSLPLLSYTPYELTGQTFQRPKELPKKGDGIWVRVKYSQTWDFRFFSHFNEKGEAECFINQQKEGDTHAWYEYSIKRPF